MIDFPWGGVFIVAKTFLMIERIILNIHHSDDYTDYLFLTAGLTNKRIIPMLDPSPTELMDRLDGTTLVVDCYNSGRTPRKNESIASYNQRTRSFNVLSRYYLTEDGSIDATEAEMARTIIQDRLEGILFSDDNLHEVYRRYFPLFWKKRKTIYADPRMFYTKAGFYYSPLFAYVPLGVMLKAIEDNQDLFRTWQGGGCNCKNAPMIIDIDDNDEGWYDDAWTLHTWCPTCSSRREIVVSEVIYYQNCIGKTYSDFVSNYGLSSLSLFDVVEELSIASDR